MNNPDDDLFDYLITLEAASALHSEIRVSIASSLVVLRAPEKEVESLHFHLGHLVAESVQIETRISFLKYADQIRLPNGALGFPGASSEVSVNFLGYLDVVVISHANKRTSFVLYRDSSPFSSDALRVLFQMLIPTCRFPIHGGSVSWGERVALVSNVGGSGKSSLIAGAVLQGARTTGDDFGILDSSGNRNKVWSQFKSFKLHKQSPIFPLLDGRPRLDALEKFVFNFDDLAPQCITASHEIDVILIPTIADEFGIQECSRDFAFSRIAPSSAGIALQKQATNNAIARLCEQIPGFLLALGPDQKENVSLTREFLSR